MTHLESYPTSRHRGFTLMEILTVLVLLGIAATVVVSALPKSDVGLVSEADRLKSHLRYAQIRAQADIHDWRVVFTNNATYQIGPVVIPGPGFTPGAVPGTGGTQGTLGDGIEFTGSTTIRFDPFGRPLSDGGFLLSSDQVITLGDGERTRTITIQGQTGLIP